VLASIDNFLPTYMPSKKSVSTVVTSPLHSLAAVFWRTNGAIVCYLLKSSVFSEDTDSLSLDRAGQALFAERSNRPLRGGPH
jgi:hypothetical protein